MTTAADQCWLDLGGRYGDAECTFHRFHVRTTCGVVRVAVNQTEVAYSIGPTIEDWSHAIPDPCDLAQWLVDNGIHMEMWRHTGNDDYVMALDATYEPPPNIQDILRKYNV